MPRFFGRYEHSLDTKGRVILPARFRGSFDTQAYLAQHQGPCLALWTPEEFEKRYAEMEATEHRSLEDRNVARVWVAGLAEVEIDRQGRFALPSYLREYAGLDGAVLMVGTFSRVELWNPSEWEARVRPAETGLANSAPTGPSAGASLPSATSPPGTAT